LVGKEHDSLQIVDLGSYDVNGSYRSLFANPPWFYRGVDVNAGPNVDVVLGNPYRWTALANNSVDVLISGQAFEHIEFFWFTIMEISRVLKPGGLCCLIAPSSGFEHRFPVDCWRFYSDGMRALMNYAEFEVLDAYTDRQMGKWVDDSGNWQDSVVIARQTDKNFRRRLRQWLHFISSSKFLLPNQLEIDSGGTDNVVN